MTTMRHTLNTSRTFHEIRRKYVCHTRTSTRQVPAGRPARHSYRTPLRRASSLSHQCRAFRTNRPRAARYGSGGWGRTGCTPRSVLNTVSRLRNNNNNITRPGPRASASVARDRVSRYTVRRKLAFHFYHYLGHSWATLYINSAAAAATEKKEEEN